MLNILRSPVLRFGFAIASVVAATLLRLALNPALGETNVPYITYFLAVILTAWACGLWPALLSVLLGAIAAAYFFVAPTFSLALREAEHLFGLFIFLFVGSSIAVLSEAMHRARARAEATTQALRESREQLSITLRSIGDAVITTDAEGLVTFMNPVAQSLTGWQMPLAKGKPLAEVFRIINEETRAEVESPVVKVLCEDKTVGLSNHTILLARDGREIPIDDSGAPIRDEDGRVVGVVLVFHDTTDHRRREEDLRTSEERYRAFVKNSSEAIWRFELEQPVSIDLPEDELIDECYKYGYLAECNNMMAEMYGFADAKEIVGARLGDFVVRSDPANIEYLRAFIRSGFRLTNAESHEIDREGQPKYFLNNLIGIVENRLLLRAWGTQSDITERKRAEEERAQLLAREQQARAIAERAADRTERLQTITAALSEALTPEQVSAVVLNQGLTALGAQAGSVTLLNAQRTELEVIDAVGLPKELIDKWTRFPINSRVPLADAARTGQLVAIESLAERERNYPNLVSLHSMTGNQTLVAVPLIVEGRTIGAMGISFQEAQQLSEDDRAFMLVIARQCAQAISRARLYEAERRSRAEAEAANRTKDEFLATLSHELRTPLTAMLGWTRLLRTNSLDETTVAHALETVERNARAQTQLIEDLLDVSRIITGKLRLEAHPVELVPVIEAAVEGVRPAAEAKSIRLQTELDPLVGPVSGDPARLQQVVWNLLSNAVKFTGKGGQIVVRLERPDSHVQISVSDTGEGIKEEFLPFVFDRFRQADGSTTRLHGGLGLGLAIVRHLVELHGGTVKAESAGEGQGATFTVTLPLLALRIAERGLQINEEAPQESNIRHPPSAILDGLRVLVVDDEPDARELLTVVLESQGASVRAVGSAAEALDLIELLKPDVMVSDIGMPNDDGYSLMRKVRTLSADEGGATPAVALTAYAGDDARQMTLAAGFQIHLAKPIDPTELLTAIASLVGKESKKAKGKSQEKPI
ncbi:MAG TPA: ATP-binding protein [Pyrinomonadaceae bacterium]|jgi:PAS domain S-box-containing protein